MDTDAALGLGFGVPVVVQRRSCSPFWCRGRFLAQFALGNMVHFPYDLVSGVMCSVFVCCFRYTEHWILREMTWSMGAMLGSTVIRILRLRDWVDSGS